MHTTAYKLDPWAGWQPVKVEAYRTNGGKAYRLASAGKPVTIGLRRNRFASEPAAHAALARLCATAANWSHRAPMAPR